MKGRLASDHTPYVTIEVLEAGVGLEFVIDTGFSGSLYLPEKNRRLELAIRH